MRNLLRLAMFAGMLSGSLSAATVVYSVQNLNAVNGSNQPLYRYIYNLIGVPLQLNQELDIRFEVTQYAALSNGVAPSGFSLLLFQPNVPPGTPGDYSLLATVNNPSMIGTFSVDVAYIGSGAPGAQQFFINQYDSEGNFLSQVSSGVTQTPEPTSILLSAAGLAALAVVRKRLRS